MKKILITFSLIALIGCDNEEQVVVFEDLVTQIIYSGDEQLIADGTTGNGVTMVFNTEADISKITAKATITNGIFLETGTNELVITPEEFPNNESIRAGFGIRGTTINSPHRITYVVNNFRKSDPLTSIRSNPTSISLGIEPLSAAPNLSTTVNLNSSLRNSLGKKVSSGTQVIFTDKLTNGDPAKGVFSASVYSTGEESTISGTYTPGFIEVDQFITIEARVLNQDGSTTDLIASKQVYITEIE